MRDDGRGFRWAQDDPAGAPGGGMGLSSMAERLSLVDGGLEIASSPGLGSRLLAWVPLEPESDTGRR